MQNMNFGFLGGVFPKELYGEIFRKSKGNMQNAADKLQWSLIEGIDRNIKNPITLLNFMFVGSFPQKYKDPIIKNSLFSHQEQFLDYNFGFVNIPLIKQLFLPYIVRNGVKKWLLKHQSDHNIIIIYSFQLHFLKALKMMKRVDPNIHICIIVPDLPIYTGMELSKYSLKKLYINKMNSDLQKYIPNIDSFVVLTQGIADYLGITDNYLVIEGMTTDNYQIDVNSSTPQIDDEIYTIVYTGSLTRKYGVLDLIKAFSIINSSKYRLVICGGGETTNEIIKASEKDDRIIYKGLLSPDEISEVQKSATVLINPRQNNEDYTKYSFPSKIMEYMFAGKPVLCFKLDGIPDEYDEYLIYFEENSSISIANKIIEVTNYPYSRRKEIGNMNKNFVTKYKNNVYQTKKIIEMISICGDKI